MKSGAMEWEKSCTFKKIPHFALKCILSFFNSRPVIGQRQRTLAIEEVSLYS